MLWSHDVRCVVLCCHVVRSGVVWCGVVWWGIVQSGLLSGWFNDLLVAWHLGLFVGCFPGWATLRGVSTLWCVVPYAVVWSVMSCLWVHMFLLPFPGTGGRAGKHLIFLF